PARAGRRESALRHRVRQGSSSAPALLRGGCARFWFQRLLAARTVCLLPRNERSRKFEPCAQASFDASHLSIVGFVVMSGEGRDAVEEEYVELVEGGVAKSQSVFIGDVNRDGNVAAVGTRKGQDIGRLILAAKTAIEFLQPRIAGDQDIDFAGDAGQTLRLA